MTKITEDEVRKLASLCKLRLSDDEVEHYRTELSSILGYVEQLQEVDLGELEPTSQVTGLVNVVRADEELNYGTSQKELLSNAPQVSNNHFKVKRVI